MLCENCKLRAATVSLKVNLNGKVLSKQLCALCADLEQRTINQSFNEAVLNLAFPQIDSSQKLSKKVCGSCGTTIEQLHSSGFVGCSNCYQAFGEEMKSILLRMQGAAAHKPAESTANDRLSKILRLNADLEQAIKERRFEDAKKIDEKISRLKEAGK